MLRNTLFCIAIILPLAGGLAACDDQGPMEEAGEKLDEAVNTDRGLFEDGPAEELGETIDNAADK